MYNDILLKTSFLSKTEHENKLLINNFACSTNYQVDQCRNMFRLTQVQFGVVTCDAIGTPLFLILPCFLTLTKLSWQFVTATCQVIWHAGICLDIMRRKTNFYIVLLKAKLTLLPKALWFKSFVTVYPFLEIFITNDAPRFLPPCHEKQ